MRDVILTLDNIANYCEAEGDCLVWQQGCHSSGAPQACVGGRPWLVRRYLATLMGWEIKGLSVVATCGTERCVAPGCLALQTQSQVLAGAYASGARNTVSEYAARRDKAIRMGWAKLTPEQLLEVRAAPREVTHAVLGAKFGMSADAIGRARRGKTWRTGARGASAFAQGRRA